MDNIYDYYEKVFKGVGFSHQITPYKRADFIARIKRLGITCDKYTDMGFNSLTLQILSSGRLELVICLNAPSSREWQPYEWWDEKLKFFEDHLYQEPTNTILDEQIKFLETLKSLANEK